MRVAIVLLILAGAAEADATFTLQRLEAWQDMGNGHGPVRLEIGDVRLDARAGAAASASIFAYGDELVEASVWLGSKRLRPPFLLEIEDGHEYLVEADPCCFLQVSDARVRSRQPAHLRATAEVDISVDGDEPLHLAKGYQPLSLGRDTPRQLTVTPKDGKPFVLWVLLRHGHRYTLVLGAKPTLVRDH